MDVRVVLKPVVIRPSFNELAKPIECKTSLPIRDLKELIQTNLHLVGEFFLIINSTQMQTGWTVGDYVEHLAGAEWNLEIRLSSPDSPKSRIPVPGSSSGYSYFG